jgi:hypothetical protein
VVGIILIPGKFAGSASYKNEIASCFQILCTFKLLVVVTKKN